MRESTALQRPETAALAPVPASRRIPHSAPAIGEEDVAAVARVLRSGQLAQGRETEAFENELAAFVGRKHAVAVSSGTAALQLGLQAVGAAYVAMPSYVCTALITAIHQSGGTPVLCDVDDGGWFAPNCVPGDVDCAIVPHLFGRSVELPATNLVIEDIAQSIGGPTGARGTLTVASFFATKLMTTGEGGAVLTDDAGIAEYVRDHRDYDNRDRYAPRHNFKLTDLQAALGRVQLRRLPERIQRRRAIAESYSEAFRPLPLTLPEGEGHVHFRYVVRTPVRAALQSFLEVDSIEAKRPVYQPVHRYFPGRRAETPVQFHGDFANADAMHETALSLPIHPSLSDDEVQSVAGSVQRFFG